MRMSREEEILSARRNSVSSRSAVGKTLNSTGLVIYIETNRTMTDTVMFALIRMSSRNDGSGRIMERTMASTASGTPNSAEVPKRDREAVRGAGTLPRALAGPPCEVRAPPDAVIADAGTGAICDVASMLLRVEAFAKPTRRSGCTDYSGAQRFLSSMRVIGFRGPERP